MRAIHLHYGLEGARIARLRAPAGYDESAGAADATTLVDRLLVAGAGHVTAGAARSLALCDRDILAAAAHTHLFGDTITADTKCETCGKAYEVRFSLGTLAATRKPQAPQDVVAADEPGWFCLSGDVTFRLPTQADLDAVSGLAPSEAVALLRERQVRAGGDIDEPQLDAAMRALCPVLDCDLDAPCPYCRSARTVRFAMARYLQNALSAEEPLLLREVHCLARAYGWSYEAIMTIPRAERRAFAGLITGEAASVNAFRQSA